MQCFKNFLETMNSRALAELDKHKFRELHDALYTFSNSGDWYIWVSWSSPDEKMIWSKFDGYGPFNERFFRWLDMHWDYWQDKAASTVFVKEIHKFKKDEFEILW